MFCSLHTGHIHWKCYSGGIVRFSDSSSSNAVGPDYWPFYGDVTIDVNGKFVFLNFQRCINCCLSQTKDSRLLSSFCIFTYLSNIFFCDLLSRRSAINFPAHWQIHAGQRGFKKIDSLLARCCTYICLSCKVVYNMNKGNSHLWKIWGR